MSVIHEGGCLCGAIRYRISGEPRIVLVCHCRFCQRRTGSAFAAMAVFREGQLEFTGAAATTYEHHSDESGRWLRAHFCHRCGTTTLVALELMPDFRSVPLGTLDDAHWLKPTRHIWTRSAHEWVALPANVQLFEQG